MEKVNKECREFRKLNPLGLEADTVNLKEKDINSLSILLFNDATDEYITTNLLSKRKFNILLRLGVFEKATSNNKRVTFRISPEYQNQVRDIYVNYYIKKFSK